MTTAPFVSDTTRKRSIARKKPNKLLVSSWSALSSQVSFRFTEAAPTETPRTNAERIQAFIQKISLSP